MVSTSLFSHVDLSNHHQFIQTLSSQKQKVAFYVELQSRRKKYWEMFAFQQFHSLNSFTEQ